VSRDQPTLLDLWAPASVHNLMSSLWPRDIIEEEGIETKPLPLYLGDTTEIKNTPFLEMIQKFKQENNTQQHIMVTSSHSEL